MTALPDPVRRCVEAAVGWTDSRPDVLALGLVGSYARGQASAESDVDLLLLVEDPGRLLSDLSWARSFGTPTRVETEEWGNVQSVRVWYLDGPEIEFAIARKDWAVAPLDPGAASVIRDGMLVLVDREGLLAVGRRLADEAAKEEPGSHRDG